MKVYIDECEGIQPPHIAFYSQAIRFNLESAMTSAQFLVQCLEVRNLAQSPEEELSDAILDSIQNVLVHTANLSKYFWPVNRGVHKVHKKRAQNLRKLFNVSSGGAIRNKDLRNHLEHLDEKLDIYLWSKPVVGNVIPAYVGPEMPRNEVPYHFFRAFFTDSSTFESLGLRLEIQPIIDDLYDIHERSFSNVNM